MYGEMHEWPPQRNWLVVYVNVIYMYLYTTQILYTHACV